MRIAIAEDERACSEQLQANLRRYAAESGEPIQMEVYSNGAELVENYRGGWDLLLLDVDMPAMNGFDTAKAIRQLDQNIYIIFITNLAQYAIKGYEVNALDYVLKPVSYYALSMKMKMVSRLLRRNRERFLVISHDGDLHRLPVSSLYYVEIFSHQLIYHTADGDITTTNNHTLSALEQELAEYGFVRCHKSCLINLHHVQELHGNMIRLAGAELPVSRNRRKAVMQAIMNYSKGARV